MIVAGAVSAFVLLAGWVLYPLFLMVVGRRSGLPTEPAGVVADGLPEISVVIASRETPEVVAARAANILASNYPKDRLSVVIGVDAGSLHRLADYRAALPAGAPVRVVAGDGAGGKAANLNAAMREVTTDLVAFADSAQQWEPDALGWMVRALAPTRVGGVTGSIATDAERGVFGLFWRYESWLRTLESRSGCVVAVTGAIHALKRRCWADLPEGLICDDLLVPLRTGRTGAWVVAEPRARARDQREFPRAVQVQRKTRTLTGMLQVCRWEPWVLVPGRHRLWLALVCHKLIRIMTPIMVLLVGAAAALTLPLQWVVLGAGGAVVVVGAVTALLGWPLRRLAEEAYWAGRLLLAPLQALANALRGRWDVWHPHPR